MQDIIFKEEQQIELKRISSGLLANSLINLCSPQMIESLRKINEFQSSNRVIGFEVRFGISYERFLEEMRIVVDTYHSWRSNFPLEYHEWKENLSSFLKEGKYILPDYLNFESWFDAYHETVLGLMPYQIITTKINSNQFKLYSEYQVLIFNGLTEEQAILKQKESLNINLPPAKAEGNNEKVKIKTIDKLSKEDIEIRDHFRIAKEKCRGQTKALHSTLKAMRITKDDMVLYKREINRVRIRLERIGEWEKKTTTKLQSI